ncbi:MAG: outer membrane beta-barrel protein [Ichthyobacteriaceae bacterium]|nr:outer membrane beta-barrel protein [Ichthyobacteriaceae bacterium]
MKYAYLKILSFIYIVGVLLMTGCSSYLHQPVLKSSKARLGPETRVFKDLKALPKAESPIVAAVYKFRDQTGQYKPSEMGQSWSTAITQGATTILIRALEESNWFVPIERENIGNLLNERKIIRSSRMQYGDGANKQQDLLPPLLFAGIILEGGIISYETNVRTGGMGLRYFGAGASSQYREDRVSIYLRAVSTSNGKVLKTIYTTKSILSQKVDVGLFKYVNLDRILEAETGYTKNEPSEMAVTEAIQMAVESMVFEGVEDKLWNVDKSEDLEANEVYKKYKKHRIVSVDTDEYGAIKNRNLRGSFGIGLNAGIMTYDGDYTGGMPQMDFSMNLQYSLNSNLAIILEGGYAKIAAENNFEASLINADLDFKYTLSPYEKFSPSILVGAGVFYRNDIDDKFNNDKTITPKLNVGVGLEYMATKKLGFSIDGKYNFLANDEIDSMEFGKHNDLIWELSLGLKYYFGNL